MLCFFSMDSSRASRVYVILIWQYLESSIKFYFTYVGVAVCRFFFQLGFIASNSNMFVGQKRKFISYWVLIRTNPFHLKQDTWRRFWQCTTRSGKMCDEYEWMWSKPSEKRHKNVSFFVSRSYIWSKKSKKIFSFRWMKQFTKYPQETHPIQIEFFFFSFVYLCPVFLKLSYLFIYIDIRDAKAIDEKIFPFCPPHRSLSL